MTEFERTVQLYGQAWNESDRARRLELLAACWAEGAAFVNPRAVVSGRETFADYMASCQDAHPGSQRELTTGVDEHHGRFRVGWQVVAQGGTPAVQGVDFGEFAPDGRIAWITSFEGWW